MGVIDKKLDELRKNGAQTVAEEENVAQSEKTSERRTPRQSEDELIAPYVTAMNYKPQYSTKLDSNGEVVPSEWGEKGSRRPDGFNVETHDVVEVKNYKVTTPAGQNNLVNNIRKQTDASLHHYGDDIEILNVIDLKGQDVTVGDIEDLTEKLEEKCPEVDLDYRW